MYNPLPADNGGAGETLTVSACCALGGCLVLHVVGFVGDTRVRLLLPLAAAPRPAYELNVPVYCLQGGTLSVNQFWRPAGLFRPLLTAAGVRH